MAHIILTNWLAEPGDIVADDALIKTGFLHGLKEVQRQLPLSALLAAADGSIVA